MRKGQRGGRWAVVSSQSQCGFQPLGKPKSALRKCYSPLAPLKLPVYNTFSLHNILYKLGGAGHTLIPVGLPLCLQSAVYAINSLVSGDVH